MKKLLLSVLITLVGVFVYYVAFGPFSGPIHYKNQAAVLEYHDIDPHESEYSISPERFELHLKALKENHYNVVSMEDFSYFLKKEKELPPNAVVITFDDGYESFYKYAYPILTKEKMMATMFLIVGYVGKPPFMTWEQITTMKQQGYSFYSHTYNAHNPVMGAKGRQVTPLTEPIFLTDQKRVETEEEYIARIKNDISKANQICGEKIGNQLKLLCFPHGKYTDQLIKLAKEEGIDYFITGNDGLNSPGDTQIKRIIAGAPYVTPDKLINKMNQEPTIVGKIKRTVKKLIQETTPHD
ncbi:MULTISPECIES: polysaccharide deacetylase family protein [unclassified Paenibacillus]|uniref:polysaccharide deacetylase family protein n=1 Tax=unclassified Paenibacillus TaxID=185978 RepID=UPI00363303FB